MEKWVLQMKSHRIIAAMLIDKEADINAKNNMGDTPLHIAAGLAKKKMVDLLIIKGADINVKNNAAETPLKKVRSSINQRTSQWPQSDLAGSEEDYHDVEDLLVHYMTPSRTRVR